MDSDAGSFVACRRRCLSVVFLFFASLPLRFTWFLHESLVSLGFLSSSIVASCRRYCRSHLCIFWLLCSPSPALWTVSVPDLILNTCNSPPSICSQISDLKLLRCVIPSSFPRTMIFLSAGKIDSHWFWVECGSRTSPLCSSFASSMSLNDSEQYYQSILARKLLCDELLTNPWSSGTPFKAAHTYDRSPFLSLLDHVDQRLGFGSVKSPQLLHGNAGVGSLCRKSTLLPLETGLKHISLSTGVKMRSSLMSDFFIGKILLALVWHEQGSISSSFTSALARFEYSMFSVPDGQSLQATKAPVVYSQNPLPPLLTHLVIFVMGFLSVSSLDVQRISVNSYWHELTMCIDCPKLASLISRQWSVSSTNLRPLKLETTSPLKPFFVDVFHQFSSRRGRERSFSPSSFSKERTYSPISLLVRGDTLPVSKTGKNYQLPSRLLSCVKVCLEPVDATILIQMGVEALEGIATSHVIVTNRSLLEDFEVRCESFIEWIASGNFNIFLNNLSNSYKFVSLSLHFIVLYYWDLAFQLAYRDLYDVATNRVIA